MESERVIVDPRHIFNQDNYTTRELIQRRQISIVENNSDHQIFYLIKKGEKLNSNKKYSIIDYLEKSIELIHPTLINLSGYSIQKPYLYYQFSPNYSFDLTKVALYDDEIMQKMFIGLASGLSYLLSKGYYLPNFSLNSIVIDSLISPKIIDYLNFEDLKKGSEKDLIIKYANIINFFIDKKMRNNPSTVINDHFLSLIERCKQQNEKMPNFKDFIDFLSKCSYCENNAFLKNISYSGYLAILQLSDKIIYDDRSNELENCINYYTLAQVSFHFFKNKDLKKLDESDIFILNSLPDFYIKPLFRVCYVMFNKIAKFSYNENISLIMKNWKNLTESNANQNPYNIYIELMKQINLLEEQRKDSLYFSNKRKNFDYKIDSLRTRAIFYLKKAYKEQKDVKIRIEYAVQYVNGIILPYNLPKAFQILDSIICADKKTSDLISQMKSKISSIIKSSSISNIMANLPQNQKEKLEKAVKGDIISMLYVGFSLFTGFNNFPVLKSSSIQFYRKAAKKSPHAMTLLGYLYLKGVFFPQNLQRARNCFRRAAEKGSLKAEIIDGLIRKHKWRCYLASFDFEDLFNQYLPSFNSIIPNDSYILPKIVYYIENDIDRGCLYLLDLKKVKDELNSNKKNCSMYLNDTKITRWNKLIRPVHSEKIILSNENIELSNNIDYEMFLAKSYFYGENDFPVNYSKAAKFFKLAADKGNSEAQLRYSLMCINSIGVKKSLENAEQYLLKSVKQNNLIAKLHYAIFIKQYKKDLNLFEKLIKECCDSGNVDAMYFYAMYLEENDKNLEKSINYYKLAADQGHFDSFIRLTNIYKTKSPEKLFKDNLELSVGLLNEPLLIKLIHLYDKDEEYEKSNILIQIGFSINYQLFNYYYCNHLIYGFGMEINIERAKKIASLAFVDDYQKYKNKYIYLMLQIFVLNNEHIEAVEFLMKFRNEIKNKYNKFFKIFYKYLDKNVAREYYIPACFCHKKYIKCHAILIDFKRKKENLVETFKKLDSMKNNPYALAILGKEYKRGTYVIRDLRRAIKYFKVSVQLKCPLAYYYIGKEFFYGRYLDLDYDKAKKFLKMAIDNNEEPRAGYYIYKILTLPKNEILNKEDEEDDNNKVDSDELDPLEYLIIGVTYGHKKALYTYGKLLLKEKNDEKDQEGIEYIRQAAYQNHRKAIKYCHLHRLKILEYYMKNDLFFDDDDDDIDDDIFSDSNDSISISDKSVSDSENNYALINRYTNLNVSRQTLDLNRNGNNSSNDESNSDLNEFWV